MIIPFGEWLPDQPDLANPGSLTVDGCIPQAQGYGPLNSYVAIAAALDARPKGMGAGRSSDGDTHTYAGDASKIYELSAGAATDISKAGGYSVLSDNLWEFETYGDDMMAANLAEFPQRINMDTGALFSDITTDFKAAHIATARDFVMMGNTWDTTDGLTPHMLRWSALGDNTDFTYSATTQSDFQLILGGGGVQKIIGGEDATIFMERSIWKATYVGSPVIWQFDEVVPKRGAYVSGGVVRYGERIFFLDSDGFFVFQGNQAIPIGNEKVDRFFFGDDATSGDLDKTYVDRITSAVDPEKKIIIWSYPGAGNVSGKPNKFLIFNYELGRWSSASYDSDMVASGFNLGYTLEQLDTITPSLDALGSVSLDSRSISGGDNQIFVFDGFQPGVMTGGHVAATFDSMEKQLIPGSRADVMGVKPLVDGGTITVQTSGRETQQAAISFDTAATLRADGVADARSGGFFHRFRVNIAAGGTWSHAQGVEVDPRKAGGR